MDNDIPAFPKVGNARGYDSQEGMMLRDWFAGMALQGIVSDPESKGTKEEFATYAYRYADAMLKARQAT